MGHCLNVYTGDLDFIFNFKTFMHNDFSLILTRNKGRYHLIEQSLIVVLVDPFDLFYIYLYKNCRNVSLSFGSLPSNY